MAHPYYSFFHDKKQNKSKDSFYPAEDFSRIRTIEENYPQIVTEVIDFLSSNSSALKPYFAVHMVNAPEKWKAFSFYFWGIRESEIACQSCPQTIHLLEQIPDILSASVSILEPHSEIKPHVGETDAIYRCHLGLVVPASLPDCGFRVGDEEKSWEEGKLLIFNDAAYHTAWNKSDKRRVVLVFDVLKPEYSKQKKWICARIRGNIVRQKISETTGILKGKRNSVTKVISAISAFFVWLGFHFLNKKSLWV